MYRRIGTILTVALIASPVALWAKEKPVKGTIPVKGNSEAHFPSLAKISMESALSMALKEFPGKPLKIQLEEDSGYLVYDVEIVRENKDVLEAVLDAGSGKLLKTEKDKADDDKDDENSEED